MKLTILRNLGKNDRDLVGGDVSKFREGAEVDVDNETAKRLMDRDLAKPASGTLRAVPAASDVTTGDDTSEVANLNVPEATDRISRMTSREKVQHIASTDTRDGVKKAAEKRLQELGK